MVYTVDLIHQQPGHYWVSPAVNASGSDMFGAVASKRRFFLQLKMLQAPPSPLFEVSHSLPTRCPLGNFNCRLGQVTPPALFFPIGPYRPRKSGSSTSVSLRASFTICRTEPSALSPFCQMLVYGLWSGFAEMAWAGPSVSRLSNACQIHDLQLG